MTTCSHFVAKITPGGGPFPADELRHLFDQSRVGTDYVAWFASMYAGEKFERAGNSICVVFRQLEDEPTVEAVVARILSWDGTLPPGKETSTGKLYAPFADRLRNWWRLGGRRSGKQFPDLALVRFDSVDEIPGQSWGNRRPAAESFGGQAYVAGWDFGTEFDTLAWVQELAARDRPGN
jgi:hypothetical protein